eukprot:3104285-Prymnesium_polylepis.2
MILSPAGAALDAWRGRRSGLKRENLESLSTECTSAPSTLATTCAQGAGMEHTCHLGRKQDCSRSSGEVKVSVERGWRPAESGVVGACTPANCYWTRSGRASSRRRSLAARPRSAAGTPCRRSSTASSWRAAAAPHRAARRGARASGAAACAAPQSRTRAR